MNSRSYHGAVALWLVVALFPCSMLEAKLITYQVAGSVEFIWTDGPVRGRVPPEIQFPLFDETSTWSATITLDDDESAYDEIRTFPEPPPNSTGYISSPGPPMDMTVNLHYAAGGGAYTFSAPASGDLEFWVGNDLEDEVYSFGTSPGGDRFVVTSWVESGLENVPWDRQFITLFLRDSTATALSDEMIPESLDITDFDDNSFHVTFTTAEGLALKHLQLFVDDISLVSTPEPSTGMLAALGGLGFLFRGRFRHSSRESVAYLTS